MFDGWRMQVHSGPCHSAWHKRKTARFPPPCSFYHSNIVISRSVDKGKLHAMAGSWGSIRRDELANNWAVQPVEVDPLQLNRPRQFSDSPSYRSHQSRNPTPSPSGDPLHEGQQPHIERRFRIEAERRASHPHGQSKAQMGEELDRILEEAHLAPAGKRFDELARENVKKRWVEQGIRNDKWTAMALGLWKHEEPLEVDSDSESENDNDLGSLSL